MLLLLISFEKARRTVRAARAYLIQIKKKSVIVNEAKSRSFENPTFTFCFVSRHF